MFRCEEMPRKWDAEDRSNRPPRHQSHPEQRLLSLMGSIGYNRSNLQGPLGKIGQNAYFSVQSKTNRGLGRTGGYGVRKFFVDWSSK